MGTSETPLNPPEWITPAWAAALACTTAALARDHWSAASTALIAVGGFSAFAATLGTVRMSRERTKQRERQARVARFASTLRGVSDRLSAAGWDFTADKDYRRNITKLVQVAHSMIKRRLGDTAADEDFMHALRESEGSKAQVDVEGWGGREYTRAACLVIRDIENRVLSGDLRLLDE